MQSFETWWESMGGDEQAFEFARGVKDVAEQTWIDSRKEISTLLKDLEKDYDHPWPNEDDQTKKHRETILEKIRMAHSSTAKI